MTQAESMRVKSGTFVGSTKRRGHSLFQLDSKLLEPPGGKNSM